jgi:hypothetical protein
MKHIFKNHANPLAMLLMALAMAFTFLACEEKGGKAECPYKKIGSPITAEVTFVDALCADVECYTKFRLAKGEEIAFSADSLFGAISDLRGTDNKASITYHKIQMWNDLYVHHDIKAKCEERYVLESVKILPNTANYSQALQTHYPKGTLGEAGKTRPVEMFFQKVLKNGNSYVIVGKSKTKAAEDSFSGTLSVSSSKAGGSCPSGETEIKGSYGLNEKKSNTSGRFAGSFTACEKSGKLSKASFKGDWVKHANGSKTPCSFGL